MTSPQQSHHNIDGFNVQYACPHCDKLFMNEVLCLEHVVDCTKTYQDQNNTTQMETANTVVNYYKNYEICSEILNENEVLITLRYINNTESDGNSGEANQNNEEGTTNDTNSLNSDRASSESDSKIFTVLHPVNLKDVPPDNKKKDQIMESMNENSNNFIEEQIETDEVDDYCQSQCSLEELPRSHLENTKEDGLKENDEQNQEVFHKLYRKIPKKAKPKPTNIGVYDFFDEEEEQMKEKELEEKEKKKDLKRRTCTFCNKVFDDPIDVLRHKRIAHTFAKILMPKEELTPFLEKEDRTECPICFKPLAKRGYKSLYIKHIMTHNIDYSYMCSICGTQFRRKDFWLNHEQRHVVQPK